MNENAITLPRCLGNNLTQLQFVIRQLHSASILVNLILLNMCSALRTKLDIIIFIAQNTNYYLSTQSHTPGHKRSEPYLSCDKQGFPTGQNTALPTLTMTYRHKATILFSKVTSV